MGSRLASHTLLPDDDDYDGDPDDDFDEDEDADEDDDEDDDEAEGGYRLATAPPWRDRDRRLELCSGLATGASVRRAPVNAVSGPLADPRSRPVWLSRRAAPHPGQNPGVPVGGVGYV